MPEAEIEVKDVVKPQEKKDSSGNFTLDELADRGIKVPVIGENG